MKLNELKQSAGYAVPKEQFRGDDPGAAFAIWEFFACVKKASNILDGTGGEK